MPWLIVCALAACSLVALGFLLYASRQRVSRQEDILLNTRSEACILELLATGREMYGLEMIEASGGRLKRGTIYVLLYRLEDKKLVESRIPRLDLWNADAGIPLSARRLYRVPVGGAE